MKVPIINWIKEAEEKFQEFNKRDFSVTLRVLIEKEDDLCVAHCLEFDIVADGKTIGDAKNNIIEAVASHISFCVEYNNTDKLFNPAPIEFWNKFFLGDAEKSKPRSFMKPYLPNVQVSFRDVSYCYA